MKEASFEAFVVGILGCDDLNERCYLSRG